MNSNDSPLLPFRSVGLFVYLFVCFSRAVQKVFVSIWGWGEGGEDGGVLRVFRVLRVFDSELKMFWVRVPSVSAAAVQYLPASLGEVQGVLTGPTSSYMRETSHESLITVCLMETKSKAPHCSSFRREQQLLSCIHHAASRCPLSLLFFNVVFNWRLWFHGTFRGTPSALHISCVFHCTVHIKFYINPNGNVTASAP